MIKGKLRLEEGRHYRFTVEKLLKIPGGERKIVLKGPDKNRYLIPESQYLSYGLKQGSETICRVDKINCRGEVFLEPEHPYYREGERYLFEISGFREIKGSRIRKGTVMVVTTITGDEIPVPLPLGNVVPDKENPIELLVLRITKGRLHLAFGKDDIRSDHLDAEKVYEFMIEGTETDIDGEEYFVATDQLGITHTIRRKYYEYYGLKPGMKFRGRVVRYREDGTRIIEPENPFYSPGQVVVIRIERNERNRNDDSWYVSGTDKFGLNHELRIPSQVSGETLKCRIVMIRKGKPFLEPILGD